MLDEGLTAFVSLSFLKTLCGTSPDSLSTLMSLYTARKCQPIHRLVFSGNELLLLVQTKTHMPGSLSKSRDNAHHIQPPPVLIGLTSAVPLLYVLISYGNPNLQSLFIAFPCVSADLNPGLGWERQGPSACQSIITVIVVGENNHPASFRQGKPPNPRPHLSRSCFPSPTPKTSSPQNYPIHPTPTDAPPHHTPHTCTQTIN